MGAETQKKNSGLGSVGGMNRKRLQFQDAVIERVTFNGKELEVVFSMIPSILVKDSFGFDFEAQGECRCTITMKNPQYEFLPKPGLVNDGHIALGELCYISIFPPDLSLDCACFLMIEQPLDPQRGDEEELDDEASDSETYMIVGDELTVNTVEINN